MPQACYSTCCSFCVDHEEFNFFFFLTEDLKECLHSSVQGSSYKTSQLETLERQPEVSRVKDNLHLYSSVKMKATDGESGWRMLEILSYNCVQKLSTGNLRIIYGKMCHRKTHEEHDLPVERLGLASNVATQMCSITPS